MQFILKHLNRGIARYNEALLSFLFTRDVVRFDWSNLVYIVNLTIPQFSGVAFLTRMSMLHALFLTMV